jgi:Cytochrome bd terminal oxidase subunit I
MMQEYLVEARQMQAMSFAVHIPLVCFALALPMLVVFTEWLHPRTGDPLYRTIARRWSKVMISLFAVGVVTGTVLSATLITVLVVVGIGASVLVPSLALLFGLVLRGRFDPSRSQEAAVTRRETGRRQPGPEDALHPADARRRGWPAGALTAGSSCWLWLRG